MSNEPRALTVGMIVEVSKAYEMDTGRRTGMDEIACCEAEILTLYTNGDAEIYVKNLGEFAVTQSRLISIR